MGLTSTFIKRPVLTLVLSTFILLGGLLSIGSLGIREYPAIDPPNINVQASLRGASAMVIQSQITEPLEESINGIDGVRSITSQSRDERSSITVEFELGIDLEQAANDVRDRVSRAIRSLPPDADPPSVAKADANSTPILIYSLQSQGHDLLALSAEATKIKERLQTVSGISEIRVWGERKYAMRLRLDPIRMAALGVTFSDVRQALVVENAELPAGSLESRDAIIGIQANTGLKTAEEFNNLIVRSSGVTNTQTLVRLRDIGSATLGAENEKTLLRINGKSMVGLAVIIQPGANSLAIANELAQRLPLVQSALPEGFTLNIAFDNTRFVRQAISEVKETILIALFLVLLVIFLFLRDWRTTLIPMAAVPISLIGVFAVIAVLGFSINVLTLLGVVLAIGLVVDDAIVVMENIYSKIEEGLAPHEAAIKGVKEIFFAVISTTLVLVAVFIPLVFMKGFTGRLFREFAFVVGGSVLISAFVALSLTGMLSARLLKHHSKKNHFYQATEPFFVSLANSYNHWLHRILQRRWLAIPVLAIMLLISLLAYKNLAQELIPTEDRSALQVTITAHEGATFNYIDQSVQHSLDVISKAIPEASNALSVTAPGFGASNTALFRVALKEPNKREPNQKGQIRSQQEIVDALPKNLAMVEGVRSMVIADQGLRPGRAAQPIQLVIQASSIDSLKTALPKLVSALSQNPVFSMVDVDLKFTKPQLSMDIDRERLRASGLNPLDVAQSLQLAYGGVRYNTFEKNGRQYNVIGEVENSYRSDPSALSTIALRSKSGSMVYLDGIIQMKEEAVPPQLFRYNRYVSATVSAGLSPGHSIGEGVKIVQSIAKKQLGSNIKTEWTGQSRDFLESSGSLNQVFLLALLAVFLILAAQFESFRDPIIILLTVPLALAGALGALWLGGYTLNLFSKIGLILLIGLVTKNGILIVEFANQRRLAGLSKLDAVADAAGARLRPILMTTLTTILGTLPIALALGAGSQSRVPMGVAIIGGLVGALVLTLFIVPAMYLYLSPTHVHGSLSHREKNAEAKSISLHLLFCFGIIALLPQQSFAESKLPTHLSLNQALTLGLQNSPIIERIELQSQISQNDLNASVWALAPKLRLQSEATRIGPNFGDSGRSNPSLNQRDDLNIKTQLLAEWPIFSGLSGFHTIQATLKTRDASLAKAEKENQALAATITLAYQNLCLQEKLRVFRLGALQLSKFRDSLSNAAYSQGSIAGIERDRARVDLLRDSIQFMQQQSSVKDARRFLVSRMGLLLQDSVNSAFTVDSVVALSDSLNIPNLRAKLLQHNPDWIAVLSEEEAARFQAQAVSAARWPELSFKAGYQWLNQIPDQASSKFYQGMSYGLTLNLPISDGGNLDRNRANTKVKARITTATKRELRINLFTEWEKAVENWILAKRKLTVQKIADSLSQKQLKASLELFRTGALSGFSLRQSQEIAQETETQLTVLYLETLAAELRIKYLAGSVLF